MHLIDSHLTVEDTSLDKEGNVMLKQENSMCIIDNEEDRSAQHEGRKITNSLFNSGLTEGERKEKMEQAAKVHAIKTGGPSAHAPFRGSVFVP